MSTVLLETQTAVPSAMNQPAAVQTIIIRVQGLELSHEKFVDLCVLCGCDYTGSIKGIGPKKALALIRQVRTSDTFVDTPMTSEDCP